MGRGGRREEEQCDKWFMSQFLGFHATLSTINLDDKMAE